MDEMNRTLANENERILVELIVEFAWRVDHGMASSMHEIVTEDIEMVLTMGTMIGKDAVKEWGARRDATGKTTSHLMSNYRFSVMTQDRAEVDSSAIIFVYGGTGVGPALPWAVTEYHDVFTKEDEQWKFKSRISRDIFKSDDH
jgi:hypothetical protein